MPPVTPTVFLEVELALAAYEQEVNASKLKRMTKQTYIAHARTFVRWLNDDYVPGGSL